MTTVGFGDFNLEHAPTWLKLFGIALMFAGIMLIGVIASLLTLFITSGRAMELRNEYIALQKRDHVIVCGLGQVGVAITRDLLQQGVPGVAVDPAATDEDHRELSLQCPLVAGDATKPQILPRAGIENARAIVICTSHDALNLEIGLTAQTTADEKGRAISEWSCDVSIMTSQIEFSRFQAKISCCQKLKSLHPYLRVWQYKMPHRQEFK